MINQEDSKKCPLFDISMQFPKALWHGQKPATSIPHSLRQRNTREKLLPNSVRSALYFSRAEVCVNVLAADKTWVGVFKYSFEPRAFSLISVDETPLSKTLKLPSHACRQSRALYTMKLRPIVKRGHPFDIYTNPIYSESQSTRTESCLVVVYMTSSETPG